MQMLVAVRVEVNVHMLLAIPAVNVTVSMQEAGDNTPMLCIHLAGTQLFA